MLNVKKAIKKRGMTSLEVASKLGVTPESLSRSINGNPSLDTLQKIADAIGVSVVDLFDRTEITASCPHCGGAIKIGIEKA
ncbi:helix-turn-helix transcriptional regulator [Olivibacter sp. CPCC 100613]|uniref:helix-turn-helix domain-containing protein n=1 Tax=Olivibacter sp. CPCC 100613 TaxID=3079931 RepID=UPI002FFA28E8